MSEEQREERLLTVSGVIHSDGQLLLEPCFELELPGPAAPREMSESDTRMVTVEFLDRRGVALHRELVPAQPICLEGADDEGMWIVSGLVPFARGSRAIRYVWNDEPLLETPIEQTVPYVKLTWQPDAIVTGIQTLTWAAGRSGDQPLSYLVLYTWNGDDWRALSLTLKDNVLTVNFAELPGGAACRIRVLASDGVNTATDESLPFEVPMKGVEPTILQPADGDTILAGTPLLLVGQAYDWERASFLMDELSWASSRDGALGVGPELDVLLSPGEHEIVVTETASGTGRSTSITIVAAAAAGFPA